MVNLDTILNSHGLGRLSNNLSNIARGSANFAGNGQEVTIPHGLKRTPTAAYAFPKVNPEGYLGEVWIRMDETNLYVGNSGSFTGEMCWVAIE